MKNEGGVILCRMVRKGLTSWEAGEEVMLTFGRRIFWVEECLRNLKDISGAGEVGGGRAGRKMVGDELRETMRGQVMEGLYRTW